MKLITFLILFIITANSFSNCLPDYQNDVEAKTISRGKLNKAGKITTISVGAIVGGFYGTMAVYLIGPWWTSVAVGGPFGIAAALPVGTTFFIISKIKKNNIKKRIDMMNLINLDAQTVDKFYNAIVLKNSKLTKEDFISGINKLNTTKALCDGSLTRKKRKLVLPKELKKFFTEKY